jgi:preprotein translocase subunit YajC
MLGNPIFMFAAMGAIMYFLVIRPQSKKAKEHQKMLSELKKGDDVSTQGGIIGKISGMKDGEVTLQLQEGVRVRVLRSAITGVYTGATPGAKPESKSEAKAS